MNNPFVSIIIPARNAGKTIKKCIDSILNLNYQNYEVIVINDGSSDDTDKILVNYQGIKLITTEGVGPAKARNIAIGQASGEFIAFTDADCIVDKDWLTELLKGFTDDKVAGVGGIQKSPPDEFQFGSNVQDFLSFFSFIPNIYMRQGTSMKKVGHNPSCNVMFRKIVLVQLGGFQEGLWPGEDVELDYRIKKAGYLLMFNPQAVVFHYRPDTFKEFGRMMFRYGRTQGYLVRIHGFFRVLHFLPISLFLFILLLLYNFPLGLSILLLIFTLLLTKLLIKSDSPILVLWLFFIALFTWNLGFLFGLTKKLSKNV